MMFENLCFIWKGKKQGKSLILFLLEKITRNPWSFQTFFLLSIYGVIKDFVAWGGMGHPTNSIKRESKVMFMSEIDQE